MLKQLFDFVQQALFQQRDLQRLKEQVAGLERGLADTNEALRKLAFEVQRLAEREQHERERLALQLENALLRFERRLPAPKSGK